MTITVRRVAALLVGALLLLSACATDDAGDASSDGAGAGMADEPAALDAGGETAAGGSGPVVDPAVAAEGREIISTAELHLRVEDLPEGVRRLDRLVADAGGYVFGEDTDLREGARTRITIKVPPARFRALLRDLGDLGDVATQTISTDDVTDQVVDLDSRIATSEASVFRLRALLAEATVVADIADIENQLLQRETELEQLRGQRRTIENQVSLATITAVLRAERTAPPAPADEPQAGFTDGLRNGTEAFRTFAVGLSAVAGALLPWTPLLLLGALGWWVVRRRRWSVASGPAGPGRG